MAEGKGFRIGLGLGLGIAVEDVEDGGVGVVCC